MSQQDQDQRRDEALMRRRMQNRTSQRRFREKRNAAPAVFDVRTPNSPPLLPHQQPPLALALPQPLPSPAHLLLPAAPVRTHHIAACEDATSIDLHTSSHPSSSVDLSWMHDSHMTLGLTSLDAHTSAGLDTIGLHVATTYLPTPTALASPVTTSPETRALDPATLSSEVLNFDELVNGWNNSSDSSTSNSTGTSPAQVASGSVVDDAMIRRMMRAMNTEQASVQLINTGSWQSALHLAARGGYTNIVRMILQRKVDTNIRDSEGQTPLMYAAAEGREDVVSCLLASGACLGRSDATGRTALHLAAERRQLTVLRIILNQNGGRLDPFLNFYDSKGRTPLHVAVEVGFEEGVEVLLQSGASLQLNCSKERDLGPVFSTSS